MMSAASTDHATAGGAPRPPLPPDLDQARAFLGMLGADDEAFTFQCFDDSDLKRGDLARIVHGTIDDQHAQLAAWNGRGAGVFVAVNETDLRGRKAENVTRIRAVFADLDGAPLRPVLTCALEPHLVVESSPGKFHCYWLVDDLPLEEFGPVQKAIAARFGGDKSVHDLPRVLRLPGYAHMKGEPFLVRIHGLSDGLPYRAERVLAEFPPATAQKPNGQDHGTGFDREMAELARRIMRGEEYHDALRDLAYRFTKAGMPAGQVVETLRGLMDALPDDAKDSRWTARRAEIPRLVSSAQEKLRASWPEPLDIIGAPELVGWPELTRECIPEPLFRYVMAEASRLNVDPVPIAVHVFAACATSISDRWRIRPKKHDPYTQHARIWTCVVKDVGSRGTEMIRAAYFPIRERDQKAYETFQSEYAAWKVRQAEWKKNKKKVDPPEDPDDPEPKCVRNITQDATIEAASQLLANKPDNFGKLTICADELVSFLGGFNRYSDKGSSTRALWLDGYDGGPQHIDRIIRGHVYVPNWSVVIAGNIQPRRLAGMAKDLIDDGLFQRFLSVHTRPSPMGVDDDRPLQTEVGREYRELHDELAKLRPENGADDSGPAPAWANDDARAVRARFMRLVERIQADTTLPVIIRETAPKWSGLLARLSLIFHLVGLAERQRHGEILEPRDLHEVTGPTVTLAATFIRRIVLPNLYRLGHETLPDEGTVQAASRWIAGHVLAHKAEKITAREIGRAYRPLRGKADETSQAMAVLSDAGWTRPVAGRHDSSTWEVNPAVHTVFATAAAYEKERREQVMAALKQKVSDL